jgi:hypothetical protein
MNKSIDLVLVGATRASPANGANRPIPASCVGVNADDGRPTGRPYNGKTTAEVPR